MSDALPYYRIRPAEPRDVGVIAHHRAAMWRDISGLSADEYQSLRLACEEWTARLFAANEYAGWLVEQAGTTVAGGGLLIREHGPYSGRYGTGLWAHIVNVYTEPPHRRRGLARRLMQTMIDWCAEHEFVDVTLTASDEGRPLYESLGFVATHDMRLKRP
jgi:GNAT superfamily N-acetyltransferase